MTALLDWDTDYMAQIANFVRIFDVDILARENWADKFVIQNDDILVFTDGSKTGRGGDRIGETYADGAK